VSDPQPVPGFHRLGVEVAARQITEKPHFRLGTETRGQEVHDLGNNELRNDKRARVGFKQRQAAGVVSIVRVDVRVQRSRIDDKGYRLTSSRRIFSISSETSERPLRPARAASKRRRAGVPR
jgi:hypothetical protein